MLITWPSTLTPCVASLRRHVLDVHPHLTPSHHRGVVCELRPVTTHEQTQMQMNRNLFRLSAENTYLRMVIDLHLMTRNDAEFNEPVRLSPQMIATLVPSLRQGGRGLYTIRVNPKDDPNLIQVVTINKHNNDLVAKFAGEGLVIPAPSDATDLPINFAGYTDARVLTQSQIQQWSDSPAVQKLKTVAPRKATFFTANLKGESILGARWWRSSISITSVTRLPSQ